MIERAALRAFLLAAILATRVGGGVARAQLEPVGPQQVVNTYTTGIQHQPQVAFGADGTLLVGWLSIVDPSALPSEIRVRRFALDGASLGSEWVVDTGEGPAWAGPKLAPLGDGYLMAWTRGLPPDYMSGLAVVRALDAGGEALGAELVLSEEPVSLMTTRTLTRGSDGGFLLTWEHSTDGGVELDIDARLLDSAGAPVGASFRINEPSPYVQTYPDVASAGPSGYVVVWASRHPGEEDHGVSGRRLDASGAALGAQFLVARSSRPVADPSVGARSDGSFVVAWSQVDSGSASLEDIIARSFSSSGTPIGSSFRVNTDTAGQQRYPDVEIDGAGAFHVVWVDGAEDPFGFDDEVRARSFDSAGTALGAERLLGSGLRSSRRVDLELASGGAAWSVWSDGVSSSGYDGVDGDDSGVVARPAWVAGQCRDLDGDGYGAPGAADCAAGPAPDCDDGDAAVNPGAVEIPANGIDDDCDPSTPTGCNAEEL